MKTRMTAGALALTLVAIGGCSSENPRSAASIPPVAATSSQPQAQSSQPSSFCVEAARLNEVIKAFQANQSRTFDSEAQDTVAKLISEADATARLSAQPDMTAALNGIAASMRSLSVHATGNSANDLDAVKQSMGQYLTSLHGYQALLSAACGIKPD